MPRTALVTGASRGIGRAAAQALEDAGLRVVAATRRDLDVETDDDTIRATLEVNLLTRKLAIAASGHGDVKGNAMSPGWVTTDMGGAGAAHARAGGRHDRLAGDAAGRRADRRLLPRSRADPLVT